uniref:Uncharacterized protein n=1 Tax=Neobodo designis TaxID=312471 RepID=A0A7S1LEG5_NEODS
MKTSKTLEQLHAETVSNFVKLKLSYMFTCTLMASGRGDVAAKPTLQDHRLRFVFSKPTQTEPEPAVTVYVDAEVVEADGTKMTYALFFEGQMYKRLVTIDSANVTGDEFNERLIDKVYDQKMALRKAHLWTADGAKAAAATSVAATA